LLKFMYFFIAGFLSLMTHLDHSKLLDLVV